MNDNYPREREERLKKLELAKELGYPPYAPLFDRQQTISEARDLKVGQKVKTAGRIILLREMGKMTFGHLKDEGGKIQVILKQDILGDEYKKILKIISIGDFWGFAGEIFVTQKGEISVLADKCTLLSKALRPLPEKWHGLKDKETCYRQRYLDLLMNPETKARFDFRSQFVKELRKFYEEKDFTEIDTPILSVTASGALAKPFKTHYEALDLDVYLRIAPELYLKEAIVGGYEKIFEVARCFRNEGMDPSHLQDFSMVEHYVAYWDFEKNMALTEEMLSTIIKKLFGTLKIKMLDRNGKESIIDWTPPWPRVSFREIVLKDSGIDIDAFSEKKSLLEEIKKKGIILEDAINLGRGNLIDALYKKVSRPKLTNPVFLINHPLDLSPLARTNDDNPLTVDRFQLVVSGWEIVNAYSELIDPLDQKKRFEEQTKNQARGDQEALNKDDDYLLAMEYGMPPISGWGMGVERIVALLTCQPNLRDVVMFPLLKPKLLETEEE